MKRSFFPIEDFQRAKSYGLLPFRFRRLKNAELLVNEVGEFLLVPFGTVTDLVARKLPKTSQLYRSLKARQFVYDDGSSPHLDLLALKYRTKKSFLNEFTQLHIFVTTLRCEHSCPYCQVSRQCQDRFQFDMSEEVADRALALMKRSPSEALTLEFQGGEPLLNFPRLKSISIAAREMFADRELRLVVATNLTSLSGEHLAFFSKENVDLSISLDGPAHVHNSNRPNLGRNSYDLVVEKIKMAQDCLGPTAVSALMTTTRYSLSYVKEIVDQYLALGFTSIFLRRLSPYGFAVKTEKAIGYSREEFWSFYKDGLDYIIDLNLRGHYIEEAYASIILRKVLTPFSTGYVDLQSPGGAGISVVVYNYDGDVYATDESRMLAEMGDRTFRLGNVLEESYEEIFGGDKVWQLANESCIEALPGCADCVYQTYCGADPLYHYSTQGTLVGNKATSDFCWFHMKLFDYLFELIERGEEQILTVFFSWLREVPLEQVLEPAFA